MLGVFSKDKFNLRQGDFEVRLSHSNLEDKEIVTPELVKWIPGEINPAEHCYTLASWSYSPEGWVMSSVGNRLFNDVPTSFVKDVWCMLRTMNCFLNQE